MANVSSPSGRIILEGIWDDENIKRISAVFTYLTFGYYTTDFESNEFDDIYKSFSDSDETGVGFFGNGRWSYSTNISYLSDWMRVKKQDDWDTFIKVYKFPYSTMEEYNSMLDVLLEEMRNKEIYLTFDYKDIEVGVGLLCEAVVQLHSSGTTLSVVEINYEEYECNLKNQCEIIYEDSADLYDAVQEMISFYVDRFKQVHLHQHVFSEITDFIRADENWYNIGAFPYFEKKVYIPAPIRKKIKSLI